MKTLAKQSYDVMWRRVSKQLYEASANQYNQDIPDINLRVAVIVLAAKDRDINFFNSEEFDNHCYWLRLSMTFVGKAIEGAWAIEKSGKVYIPPAEIDEDEGEW